MQPKDSEKWEKFIDVAGEKNVILGSFINLDMVELKYMAIFTCFSLCRTFILP